MRLPASIEHLLTEMSARYGIDAGGMSSGVRARLEGRLALTALPLDANLELRTTRLGVGHVHTTAYEAPRLRKLVLSEVSMFPVVEGFAVTVLPRPEVVAPIFAADFMLLPAALTVDAEIYGAPSTTRGVLKALGPSFEALGGHRRAKWAAPLASGEGLHARVSPRLVGDAFGAITAALGAYLDAVAAAPEEPTRGNEQASFFRLMHAHGPRLRMRLLFGEAWAERYSRLLFE